MTQRLSEQTKMAIGYAVNDQGSVLTEIVDSLEFSNPFGAMDYYVDGNRVTSGSGLSWDTAFKTLAEAITASNASIALSANRWWARRNRIFVLGDQEIDEDLTILPEKCDVIGVGSDLYPMPRIIGNHTIAATRPTAGKGTACRFIHCAFQDEDGTSDVFAIPAGCHGLQFLGCTFMAKGAGSAGKALEITDCPHIRIKDCEFNVGAGAMANIFATAISIEGTTIYDFVIENCRITATIGIAVANGTAMGSLIRNNVIRATGLTIDENSDDVQIVDNRLISDAASDGGGADAVIDCALTLAVGNRITCSDHVNAPFPIEGTLS